MLTTFSGVSVHAWWVSSFRDGCHHVVCRVHLQRERIVVAEDVGWWWAATVKRLLLALTQATNDARTHGHSCLSPPDVATFTAAAMALLAEGDQAHPRVTTPPGTRGTATHHLGRHLLDRLRTSQDAVVCVLNHLQVPCDTTLAERGLRMINMQQHVSGSFRRTDGAISFCRIRGDLSTVRAHELPIFSALQATLCGHPLLPSFSQTWVHTES